MLSDISSISTLPFHTATDHTLSILHLSFAYAHVGEFGRQTASTRKLHLTNPNIQKSNKQDTVSYQPHKMNDKVLGAEDVVMTDSNQNCE